MTLHQFEQLAERMSRAATLLRDALAVVNGAPQAALTPALSAPPARRTVPPGLAEPLPDFSAGRSRARDRKAEQDAYLDSLPERREKLAQFGTQVQPEDEDEGTDDAAQ